MLVIIITFSKVIVLKVEHHPSMVANPACGQLNRVNGSSRLRCPLRFWFHQDGLLRKQADCSIYQKEVQLILVQNGAFP